MIKIKDAEEQIRHLWRMRPDSEKTVSHIMLFYQWLKKNHPELLEFRVKSYVNKYQVVNSFVRDLCL